jgi:ketosteroid isomerase-like protein
VNTDNLAIVRTLVDGMDRPDLADLIHRLEQGDTSVLAEFKPLFDLLDPEVVWDVSAQEIPDLGVFRGHEGVVTFWLKWMAEWEDWSFETRNFEAIGDHVVFDVEAHGRSRSMGVDAMRKQAHVATLRAGKLVAYRTLKSRDDALAAIEVVSRQD